MNNNFFKRVCSKKIWMSALSLLLVLCTFTMLSPRDVFAAPETGLYVTTDRLNLRMEPSTSAPLVDNTVIPKNCSIIIDGFTDDYLWGHTSYGGSTGWVYMQYTKKIDDDVTFVGKTPNEIVAEISSTYTTMRRNRGSSYDGWCGQYVKDMLKYLGIGYVGKGGSYNGNKFYGNLTDGGVTASGYKQVKYPGKTCLDDILDANGGIAYNIVISFNAFYSSSGYNPYGHVVFINAIIDDMVYYSESFSMSRGQEGAPQVYSLSNFTKYYYNYFGNPIGAVHMSNGAVLKPVSGTRVENVASTRNLTVVESGGNADYEKAPINIHSSLGSSERQSFHFEASSKKGLFTIRPEASENRVLTVASPNSLAGSEVVLSTNKETDAQLWYFEKIDSSGYRYVIRSKANPDYVLTAASTEEDSKIVMQKFASGNTRQIWKIPTAQNLIPKVESITLSQTELTVATDSTAKLTASVFPDFASNAQFKWSSDDPTIATVQGGTISALKKGTTLIRVTLNDGSLYATCMVTVQDELTLIGDANRDNDVSILDFNILFRYLNGSIPVSESNIENSHINRDGTIDQTDLAEYQKYFSGDTECLLYKELGPHS